MSKLDDVIEYYSKIAETLRKQIRIEDNDYMDKVDEVYTCERLVEWLNELKLLRERIDAQPDLGKYEYHYDHTDCIWYRPEARNRCPSTCAQYRDGWNDAMNYIFRDGKGYRPYRRDRRYEDGNTD